MRLKIAAILFLLLFFSVKIFSQSCPIDSLGQNPSTAFPVCGTDTFSQASVNLCGNDPLVVPGCANNAAAGGYTDRNPYWYKFTCYTSGTLGFVIQPNDPGDDYDWQLYDVTGISSNNLDIIFNTAQYVVTGNWSGTYGATGARTGGANTIECASVPSDLEPSFSAMPLLKAGHQYLLLISHYTQTQSGYGLSFGGGTASITDTTPPRLQSALANCNGQQINVVLNKQMQCKTVAPDGTDFYISPNLASPASASGLNCNSGFDMDSLTISLNQPLPPGNYFIVMKKGSDQNTLLDNCNTPVPVDDSIPLTILPQAPTPMDSITPVSCAPDTLQLVFQRNIQCSSVADDGSDFVITGPFPITVKSASGNNCNNGVSNIIDVVLSAPIVHAGNYTITLQKGSDRNTIIDECGQETPAGEFLNFAGFDTVSAAFTYNIFLGCKLDSVQFFQDGRNGINQWTWVFDSTDISHLQNPVEIYSNFLGEKNVQLLVSNGVCTDSASVNFLLGNYLKALFEGPSILCPSDAAIFKDSSIGQIVNWYWNFGDGFTFTTATPQNPPPQYYPTTQIRDGQFYPVQLIVENNLNCFDTTASELQVLYNCYIAVPSAFTPNGDGLNDYLYPLNAYKAKNLDFKVYNRYGQLVFHTTDWTIKWDGTINGNPQGSGTYVWMLSYTDGDTGKKIFQKGTSVLIR
jgi:gliding motility-associated-like protein